MVTVTTVYLGAAPEVVETSVTQVLEDQLIGIEGIKHVTSVSREQVSQINVEFELYRDVDAAAADVRDRVARARSTLPQDVEEPVIAKRSADARPIQWIALYGGGLVADRALDPGRDAPARSARQAARASPRSGSPASAATRCGSGSTTPGSPARR